MRADLAAHRATWEALQRLQVQRFSTAMARHHTDIYSAAHAALVSLHTQLSWECWREIHGGSRGLGPREAGQME